VTLDIENLPKNRTFTAIICDDERGRQEFTGPQRVRDAAAYTPKGSDVQWWLRRENGTLAPVRPGAPAQGQDATNRVASEPAPPVIVQPPPPLDAVRLALEYGDRNSQLIARAYADAYKVAGQSWAAVVQPLAQALSALSSRVVTLESRLEELPALEAAPEPEPREPSPLDQLAEGVLAGVVQGAMAGPGPKT
jgi:hypothetical protein